MACDTSVPEKPATRINENEDDVDDCDAGNAFPKAEKGPQYAADYAQDKPDSFFAADEPKAGQDKGCSAPVHAITPFLLLFAVPSCFRRRGCLPGFTIVRRGLGVVHGPWESVLQGNPRGAI